MNEKKDYKTYIQKVKIFYLAEFYHQKYLLQNNKFMKYFLNMEEDKFINSTTSSKVLGYISGHGKYDNLIKEFF